MHQIRSVSLYSYMDVAGSLGLDGPSLLTEVGISPADLDRTEGRLPAGAVAGLLERSAALCGCDSFGIRMAQCRSFASLGGLSLLLERLQNVEEVLQAMGTMPRTLSDILIVSSDIKDEVVSATYDLMAPFNVPQGVDLTVGLGYLSLVGASHGRWKPEVVHFTHRRPRDVETFQRFFRAPLAFDSEFNGFSFDIAALRAPLPLANKAMAQNARRLLQNLGLPAVRAPLSDHARHSIKLLLRHGRATIYQVAKNLGKTERELQRNLQTEGSTFAGLLVEVRRDLAIAYLRQSSQNLTSISQALGYANPSSFTRWFDREFGASPSRWLKTDVQNRAE